MKANTAAISDMSHTMSTIPYDTTYYQRTGVCVKSTNTVTGEYCTGWEGATLKKLPLFGDESENTLSHFEWPTQEDFDQMSSPAVKLQSITLTTYTDANVPFGPIRVNLSNGEQKLFSALTKT